VEYFSHILSSVRFKRLLEFCDFLGAVLVAPEVVGASIGEERSKKVAAHVESLSKRLTPSLIAQTVESLQQRFAIRLFYLFLLIGFTTVCWELAEIARAVIQYPDTLRVTGMASALIAVTRSTVGSFNPDDYRRLPAVLIWICKVGMLLLALPILLFALTYHFWGAGQRPPRKVRNTFQDWADRQQKDWQTRTTSVTELPLALLIQFASLVFTLGGWLGTAVLSASSALLRNLFRFIAVLTAPGRMRRIVAISGLSLLAFVFVCKMIGD